MPKCILCFKPLSLPEKPEHILLNALGGRKTVTDIVCSKCNHEMGVGADQHLADSVSELRNIVRFRAGDGDDAPKLLGIKVDGETYDLDPGAVPVHKNRKPLKMSVEGNQAKIEIRANSDRQSNGLIIGAAKKILKEKGNVAPTEAEIDAIARDLRRSRKHSFHPAPIFNFGISFGDADSQRAMAKAALILWADLVGNAEMVSKSYTEIREFIRFGTIPAEGEPIVEIDTRMIPRVDQRFGSNPNIVWAGSDQDGRVFGYFYLYGLVGWRFLLRTDGGPADNASCLISNPFEPKHWGKLDVRESPLSLDWVIAELQTTDSGLDAVKARLAALLRAAKVAAMDRAVLEAVKDGFGRVGATEGEEMTTAQFEQFADYVARRSTAVFMRRPFHDDPDKEE